MYEIAYIMAHKKQPIMYKILNIILIGINRRPLLILLNLVTFLFSFYCLKQLIGFLHGYSVSVEIDTVDEMNDVLNGIAGVLIAFGVLLESRHIIIKMAKGDSKPVDEFLNEVAEHNGLGLLLVGLFMEIITLMIELPNTIIDTSGLEIYLFYGCFFLIGISMLVELDFIKDYIKSYFVPVEKLLKNNHPNEKK